MKPVVVIPFDPDQERPLPVPRYMKVVQNDGTRDNRAGEASTAHFVDSAHPVEAQLAQDVLERARRGYSSHLVNDRFLVLGSEVLGFWFGGSRVLVQRTENIEP